MGTRTGAAIAGWLGDPSSLHTPQGYMVRALRQTIGVLDDHGFPAGTRPGADRPRGDRKSTRLNSSHVAISYAVFCLKKKNNGSTPTSRSVTVEMHDTQRHIVEE